MRSIRVLQIATAGGCAGLWVREAGEGAAIAFKCFPSLARLSLCSLLAALSHEGRGPARTQ